jgi:hypothetical protein
MPGASPPEVRTAILFMIVLSDTGGALVKCGGAGAPVVVRFCR